MTRASAWQKHAKNPWFTGWGYCYRLRPAVQGKPTIHPAYNYSRGLIMDATAIGAILSVVGSIIVFAFLGVKITRLMKTCNSQD